MEPGMGNPEPTMAASEPVIELGGQKKSKAPVIVAVLCAILAVAGVGFGVFEMMQNKGKSIEDLKIEIENSDGTKTELETDKITISEDKSKITIKDSAKARDYTIYRSLVGRYVSYDYSDSDLIKGALAGDIENPSYKAYVVTGATDMIEVLNEFPVMSGRALKELSKKYFEKENTLAYELKLRCGVYSYDSGTDNYNNTAGGCGGVGAYYSVFDVIGAEDSDDSLKVEISFGEIKAGPIDGAAWNGELYNGEEIAKSAEIEGNGSTITYEVKHDNELTKYFYEHPDEFNHYTLTFKKDNKNYLLSSISKAE